MQIWKLYPVDHAPVNWQFSRYRGEVIVRAETEDRARQISSNHFMSISAGGGFESPWECSVTVLCKALPGSGHRVHGQEEILSPRLPHSFR